MLTRKVGCCQALFSSLSFLRSNLQTGRHSPSPSVHPICGLFPAAVYCPKLLRLRSLVLILQPLVPLLQLLKHLSAALLLLRLPSLWLGVWAVWGLGRAVAYVSQLSSWYQSLCLTSGTTVLYYGPHTITHRWRGHSRFWWGCKRAVLSPADVELCSSSRCF
ncbi:hypothetical protein MPTK1_6g08430 [Marchantia polymorpha subsp. ruderalis]|uniref:Uncharacterized protein n=2 Tax=Marchantia polymorpha TaxID=3197 RepID=A0AAF6BPW5_MARPO|nr:hypothetical protein MARPO_0060s0078 [Marchantia polymorpha]BBN14049.1 hypothetical protein Mp_6g08430 [Marchantia polymorpha subsp. ruderalis]|eukprot:PTQ36996.1 hypothetical protein MARPO_0060s0078 [Marchantia polymorpha]